MDYFVCIHVQGYVDFNLLSRFVLHLLDVYWVFAKKMVFRTWTTRMMPEYVLENLPAPNRFISTNRRTHGQVQRTPQQLKIWLSTYYEEVKNAQEREGGVAYGEVASNTVDIRDLALFVDASVSTTLGKVGLGATIFTANKRLQATLSKLLEGTLSVFHAEALALLVGLGWAQTVGLPIKILLSD